MLQSMPFLIGSQSWAGNIVYRMPSHHWTLGFRHMCLLNGCALLIAGVIVALIW
jgi:hypothetical protein